MNEETELDESEWASGGSQCILVLCLTKSYGCIEYDDVHSKTTASNLLWISFDTQIQS